MKSELNIKMPICLISAKKYLEILTQVNLKSSAGEDISKQGEVWL